MRHEATKKNMDKKKKKKFMNTIHLEGTTSRRNRVIAFILSAVIVFSILPEPALLADAISPYTEVEHLPDGVTIYHNKDGSKTAVIEVTDEQIESMSDDEEADRLVDTGDFLEGAGGTVEVNIKEEFIEDNSLVTVKKNDTSIAFYPVIVNDVEVESIEAAVDSQNDSDVPAEAIQQEISPDSSVLPESTEETPLTEVATGMEVSTETGEGVSSTQPAESQNIKNSDNSVNNDELQTVGPSENSEPKPSEEVSLEVNPSVTPSPQQTDAVSSVAAGETEEVTSIDASKQGYSNGTYDSVLYEDVFDKETDIELSALKGGVKENIIINEYVGSHLFSYVLNLKGLLPEKNGGSIALKDASGKLTAKIAAPFMQDSSGSYSEDIQVELIKLGEDLYQLTYTPSDAWLSSDSRSYPVQIDPTVTYTSSTTTGIEDNYVSSNNPNSVNDYNESNFYVGNYNGGYHIAYIRPVIPDSLKNAASNVIIKSATVRMYERSGKTGGCNYSIYQVIGGEWNSQTITYNNAPAYSSDVHQTLTINGQGFVTWDITRMFSSWFNSFDQKGNFGFVLKADQNIASNYRRFTSADTSTNRLTYSVTYYEAPADPGLVVTPVGNGTNSGTGYVNLSWNAVDGADRYYVGILNGKEYEYYDVGNTTSWSTHNMAIWPTQSEISSGRYQLHHDGAGTELPMVPAFTYTNAGTTYASSLRYYFKVIPANSYGQVPNPGHFGSRETILPDTMQPNQPSSVSVSPSILTNAANISVSWSGVMDYNNTSGGASDSLGTGQIQYRIDDGAWYYTSQNTASGTYIFSTNGLGDGTHAVNIRGVDSSGNVGISRGTNFYTDKTGPTIPTLSIAPSSWTKNNYVSVAWAGISDLNALNRVEYNIDGSGWNSTNQNTASGTYTFSTSGLADGNHIIYIRGIDVVGNAGTYRGINFYTDKTGPTAPTLSVNPNSWTKNENVSVTWSNISDLNALNRVEYYIDGEAWKSTNKNTSSGSYTFSTIGLTDGGHTIYIRGVDTVGNNGSYTGVNFYTDKTGPTAPTISVTPSAWTKNDNVSLTWSSIADLNDLDRVEYNIDGGEWNSTEHVDKTYSAYNIPISALASGIHTISVRGIDDLGNVGDSKNITIYKDIDAPVITDLDVQPSSWTAEDSIDISWTGLLDIHSGMKVVSYELDGAAPIDLSTTSVDDTFTIGATDLDDGEHSVLLNFTDNLDNTLSETVKFYRDASDPLLSVISPLYGDIVNGMLEIWGSVEDIAIDEWTVTAVGSSGKTVEVARDTAIKTNEMLGILNTNVFSDGESIEIILEAKDKAGNDNILDDIFVTVDKSAKPVTSEVNIISPQNAEYVKTATTAGTFSPSYSGDQAEGYYYIDSIYQGNTEQTHFSFDAMTFDELSSHTISVISEDENGDLHYSKGLASYLTLSDTFTDDTLTSSKTGVAYTAFGARLDGAMTGKIISKEVTSPKNILALQLKTSQATPAGTSIEYYYSLDSGTTWNEIEPDKDVPITEPAQKVTLKVVLNGDGTETPVLYGVEVNSIIEMNPMRVSVKLLRDVESFSVTHSNPITRAIETIYTSPIWAENKWLFVDDQLHNDSFDYDTLTMEERTDHTLTLLAENEHQEIAGSGNAKIEMLMRNNVDQSGMVESGMLSCSSPIYVIRLDVLTDGNVGAYYYSLDGTTWLPIKADEYTVLAQSTMKIYLKAEMGSATLRAWHLEGVSATSKRYRIELVRPPVNVVAVDLGEFYEDEQSKQYVLSWLDPNNKDTSVQYTTRYVIYRNGEYLADTAELTYTDMEYVTNAQYSVAVVKEYETQFKYPTRQSLFADADITKIDAPPVIEPNSIVEPGPPVDPEPEEELPVVAVIPNVEAPVIQGVNYTVVNDDQCEYVNSLYGGNYTFSDSIEAPTGEIELDQKLLGKSKYCALGFEPVNFNTGNFFLNAQDFYLAGEGKAAINIMRTYNTQSSVMDGPFGARWECAYSAHLLLYKNGDVGYRRSDGSQVNFRLEKDGTYKGYDDDGLSLTMGVGEFIITERDGTQSVFGSGGLMMYIKYSDGNIVGVKRDDNGLITEIALPSGKTLQVSMDKKGHITKLTTPMGLELTYEYSGNNLISFTDGNGSTTRYMYDSQGRMKEWYDGNGNNQVVNKYDSEDRVVWQTDANGGEYTIEYEADRTITTDAEGNKNEIWFDSLRRTIKEVDAKGNETLYFYDEGGNLSGTTDAFGNLTSYEYDVRGNKIKQIAPDGSEIRMDYDKGNNLIKLTDQLGNVTRYDYDAKGNLISQSNADGSLFTYEYNGNGQLIRTVDALGHAATFEYDGSQLIKSTNAQGHVTTYDYDADGRMTSSTDALGHTTRYEYDGKGNVVKQTYADGTYTAYEYDALGNKISMTDPKGNTIRYEYDGLYNLIKTTLPDGTVTTAAYSPNMRVTQVTDALGNAVSYTYDDNGNATSVTDALGNVTVYEYDKANRLVKETLPTGATRLYKYDELTGLLEETTDENGAVTTFFYDAAGNLIDQQLANSGTISYEYDSMGRLVRQISATGAETTFTYYLSGELAKTTNPLGGVTTYTYDGSGNVLTVTDALGGVTAYTYDALGRVTSVTDLRGAKTTYEYDVTGKLVKTTDALGNCETYTYDKNGNLAALTDVDGSAMRFDYNELGRMVGSVQKNGGRVTTEYDAAGNIAAETDVLGAKTTYEYNANGLATKVTDALGQSATMSYDALGNITKITSPDGSKVLYEYEPSGRARSMTDETGTKTTYRYDEVGNIVAETTNGATTTYAYDKAGNITSVTDAEGREVKFTYDKAGNIVRMTYPDGTCSMTEYDVLGRVVKELPRAGAATAYTYDAAGNVTAITNGKRTTSYEYDLLGRLIKTTYPDGSTAAYEYDLRGNLVTETDALGNSTQYEYDKESLLTAVTYANSTKLSMTYDKAGNILSETDAAGGKTTYTYDPIGRLTAVTDALDSKTAYEYDAMDNLKKVKDANGHITTYAYDAKGNMTSETDALGNTVTYDYTPEGWLKQITKADGKVISFDYDKTGNLITEDYAGEITTENTYNELGKLTVTKSEEGETKYQYDGQGYLISVTNPDGDVVQYTYDQYGRKETLKYPDGRVVKYAYDGMDRLTKVTGLDGRETQYTYDKLGQRTQTTDGTLTTEYSYDNVGNLLKQATTGKTNVSFEYAYDSNNSITAETRTENGKTVQSSYTYDPRGQLTAFIKSDGYSESYAYDPAGNMTQKSIGGVDISMTYNAANQLKSLESAKGKIDYSYDKNGSLTSKAMGEKTDTYSYDVMDQLTAYTGYDGYQQRYTYNAQGMMSARESKGNANRLALEEIVEGKEESSSDDDDPDPADEWVKTSYIYDITMPYYEVLTEEMDGVTTAYDYGIERISAIKSDFWYNIKTAYVYDGRGSVAQEVSYDISWYTIQTPFSPIFNISKSYTPFGEQLGEKTSGYGFNAEYYDAATGMVNLRARQYEPTMMRFMQKDTVKGNIQEPWTQNLYAYCGNDPVNFVDPSGHKAKSNVQKALELAKKTINNVQKTVSKLVKNVQKTVNNTITHSAQKNKAKKKEATITCPAFLYPRTLFPIPSFSEKISAPTKNSISLPIYTGNQFDELIPKSDTSIGIGPGHSTAETIKKLQGFTAYSPVSFKNELIDLENGWSEGRYSKEYLRDISIEDKNASLWNRTKNDVGNLANTIYSGLNIFSTLMSLRNGGGDSFSVTNDIFFGDATDRLAGNFGNSMYDGVVNIFAPQISGYTKDGGKINQIQRYMVDVSTYEKSLMSDKYKKQTYNIVFEFDGGNWLYAEVNGRVCYDNYDY